MVHNTELGRRGELIAAKHLEASGMRIVEKNWRCNQGEIDIVANDAGTTVFIEVKTRSGRKYGHPFEAITAVKLARLRCLAITWCEQRELFNHRIRLDAVAVFTPVDAPAVIEHLKGLA